MTSDGLRQKEREDEVRPGLSEGDGEGGQNLGAVRAESRALVDAGRDSMRGVLSMNPMQFKTASRQTGGQ